MYSIKTPVGDFLEDEMSKRGFVVPVSLMGLLMAGLLLATQGPESGLNVGATVPAFNPVHVTGPDKGTTKCPP
ncbi:MAG: hypothetical protein K6T17_09070 [Fimbriimonadales bacterium]|nr:hypothetical protein [Fimbriimonadales bacterium]